MVCLRAMSEKSEKRKVYIVRRLLAMFVFALVLMNLTMCWIVPKGPYEAERLPSNPQYDGGTWDISFDNGMSFKDATCVNWDTLCDESEWILPDGTRIIHNRNTVSVIPAAAGGKQ